MDKLREFIKSGWGLARTEMKDGDFSLPWSYVPPCIDGNFRVLFYWDTYFTNLGLIIDGHTDWAIENFNVLTYGLDVFGCVPNCVKENGAQWCSQPPLLGLIIKDIYSANGDEKWLESAVESLEKEYRFWMKERITAIGLNQYGCNQKDDIKLSEYYDYASKRIGLDKGVSKEQKSRVARNLIAEAESGEDYTPRYKSHNALNFVQIDLNSHLYGVEDFLCKYFSGKDGQKSSFYAERRQKRATLIEKYCFNKKTGVYCDYDFVSGKQSEVISVACFMPFFYGFANASADVLNVYKALKTKSGVVSCCDTGDYGYQWGYPNIWAPHQYFSYVALKNCGKEMEAEEIRRGYTELLSSVYRETGTLWERYNENGVGEALEYSAVRMLGWTAGVYAYFSNGKDQQDD